MLEEILVDHPRHKLLLGGDFNTEMRGNSPFDNLWREFIKKHDLVCCDQFSNSSSNNNNNNNFMYILETYFSPFYFTPMTWPLSRHLSKAYKSSFQPPSHNAKPVAHRQYMVIGTLALL